MKKFKSFSKFINERSTDYLSDINDFYNFSEFADDNYLLQRINQIIDRHPEYRTNYDKNRAIENTNTYFKKYLRHEITQLYKIQVNYMFFDEDDATEYEI